MASAVDILDIPTRNVKSNIAFLNSCTYSVDPIILDSEWTLVTETACFSAEHFVSNYTFTPPFSGNVTAVKLDYKTGSVTCTLDRIPWTYWGCFFIGYGVQLVRHSVDSEELSVTTVLPTESTLNIDRFDTFSESTCNSGIGCNVYWYSMTTSVEYEYTVEWFDSSANLYVDKEDIFSLQYGEGCCQNDTEDNRGTVCAKVYFHYEMMETTPIANVSEYTESVGGSGFLESILEDEFMMIIGIVAVVLICMMMICVVVIAIQCILPKKSEDIALEMMSTISTLSRSTTTGSVMDSPRVPPIGPDFRNGLVVGIAIGDYQRVGM